MTLLSTIYNSLQEGENLQITVQKAKGKAAVFVIPSLGEENKAECEQARALRSALATPLAFRGEIADIEEALEHGLQDYLSLQSSGRKTYDTLARLRTAVNKGKEAVTKKNTSSRSGNSSQEEINEGKHFRAGVPGFGAYPCR